MHEIHCSIRNVMHIHFLVLLSMFQYVPSTYWYILVKVLELQVQTSMYSFGTVPQWYILRYSTKQLVLLCSSTYLLVLPYTRCTGFQMDLDSY